ncbi:hypothetical protein LTR02_005403 [Friedmanniomyces endolithicus]|nr:hypothetical protein LTR94_020582 [Friedmanniomyces endolithicus]KAK0788222.1 hypothetical protein LTR38_011403 [Friedmanniomyces endolithicus]KAK0801882.1 hypothetical protein LTR59_005236 [Friedmanniomyces endolithicus]KAK0817419.1 hypothetical protein LTR75_003158 [Friedmanniomyces endolithicus]KAK0866903.1 hypothetical protein LTS02_004464 [Friedmanniomyces endolithicus]
MSQPSSATLPHYELLYHPGNPGRGEFIRLALEAAQVPYTDVSNSSKEGYALVQQTCMSPQNLSSSDGNPPVFAPPALRIPGGGGQSEGGGRALVIAQTPNILWYLGEKLEVLAPGGGEAGRYHVQQVVLTALDLNNEVHDTHHPVAVGKYYEEQREEALKKAQDVRETRIPKYLSYFDRVRQHNERDGGGKGMYLVGSKLSTADTTVWQVLDGLMFAFPKEMEARKKEFPELLGTFYGNVKEEGGLKEYLSSKRRLPYSMGVFRYYKELDRQ